ncbi:RpiB/LacA/LacB family sugar-phosphate isomerase [Ureaplasma ceti]|uniref:Ribose-5-phosphate isomerase n=1 Tax=Ureaplasma ceti TaxID=3119530 RepID=A0ABP9UDZ2_9BACT
MTNNLPVIYLGGDHASFFEREKIQKHLFSLGFQVISEGSYDDTPTNYAQYAIKVGNKVQENPNSVGIVMCGSGIGVNIAINKVRGVKSTLVYSNHGALQAKDKHFNAIALGTRFMPYFKLEQLVDTFLGVDKLDTLEVGVAHADKEGKELTFKTLNLIIDSKETDTVSLEDDSRSMDKLDKWANTDLKDK